MFVKLIKATIYKGKAYKEGDIIEVGQDLASKMILAGKAVSSTQREFEEWQKQDTVEDFEKMTVEELKEKCETLGLEDYKNKKKAELIDLIKQGQ